MTARRSIRVAAAWLAAAVAGCGGSGEPGPGVEGAATPVVLGMRPFLYNAPVHIALEEGYFADEGLDVRIHMISGHAATSMLMLDRGDIDVLLGGVFLGFFNAISEGSAVRMVADAGHFAPGACSPWALVAQRDLARGGRLSSPASLRGLRIDMNPNISEGYFVETYLRGGGLTLADVEIAEVPLAARQEAMNRASIDMTAISEPWLSRILADGHVVHVAANEVVPDLEFATVLVGGSLRTDRREVGRRFMAGYLRGLDRFLEGKTPRNIEVLSATTDMRVEELERACWPSVRRDGSIRTEPLQAFQRWGVEKGLVDRVVEPREYLDAELLDEARPLVAGGGR